MKNKFSLIICIVLLTTGIISCKKNNPTPTTTVSTSAVLDAEANNVIVTNYTDLANHADSLYQALLALQASPTSSNLSYCRTEWIKARRDYEQSEGFLFGPVVTYNIDPDVDTWPVDSTSIDSLINGKMAFTQGYVDSLESAGAQALTGFHPIEYLLYGPNGSKTATAITTRQFQYIIALASNIQTLTTELPTTYWNSQSSSSYYNQFITAGNGSAVYSTLSAAYQEMANAMIGICDEVGNQKMEIPYVQHNASLEESHYSNNSLNDFKYNIIGAENIYLGQFTTDAGQGTASPNGISNVVMQYNLTLDSKIKTDINTALAALDGITVPFGQAITQQPTQVQNAINAINTLESDLQTQLLPFIQQYVK